MSKLVAPPSSSAQPAAAQPPAAYGAAAMLDLADQIQFSACEILNAKGEIGTVLKQGLRDQAEMIVESDADEQLLIHIAFQTTVKIHSISLNAPSDGRAPKQVQDLHGSPHDLRTISVRSPYDLRMHPYASAKAPRLGPSRDLPRRSTSAPLQRIAPGAAICQPHRPRL